MDDKIVQHLATRYTVKPVLRDHLNEVQFIGNFLWQGKRWPFNTGVSLIEVSAWADLIV